MIIYWQYKVTFLQTEDAHWQRVSLKWDLWWAVTFKDAQSDSGGVVMGKRPLSVRCHRPANQTMKRSIIKINPFNELSRFSKLKAGLFFISSECRIFYLCGWIFYELWAWYFLCFLCKCPPLVHFMFIMYTQKCSIVAWQSEPLLWYRQIYIPGFPPAAPLTCHSSNSCM